MILFPCCPFWWGAGESLLIPECPSCLAWGVFRNDCVKRHQPVLVFMVWSSPPPSFFSLVLCNIFSFPGPSFNPLKDWKYSGDYLLGILFLIFCFWSRLLFVEEKLPSHSLQCVQCLYWKASALMQWTLWTRDIYPWLMLSQTEKDMCSDISWRHFSENIRTHTHTCTPLPVPALVSLFMGPGPLFQVDLPLDWLSPDSSFVLGRMESSLQVPGQFLLLWIQNILFEVLSSEF